MALNISKVNGGDRGKAEFNAALAAQGGVFESGENAVLVYPDANFPNPFYNYYVNVQRDDYAISDVFVEHLAPSNYGYAIDDRIFAYSTNVSASSFNTTGFPYGLERGQAVAFANSGATWGRVIGSTTPLFTDGTNFRDVTAPVNILGSSEVYLARAEAALLGWTSESVEDNYYAGIAESWKKWDSYAGTLTDVAANAFGIPLENRPFVLNGDDYDYYISLPEVELDGSDDYAKIATQEWINHYPAGWKGWTDWRRTGYPQLTPAAGQSQIPLRYPYGPNEYNLNSANATAAAANYNGDSQYAPLWWDK